MILVRYSEIGIKGRNRILFERQLEKNIIALCKRRGTDVKVKRPRGRFLLETELDPECLKTVFGIVSASPAVKAKSLDEVKRLITAFFPKPSQTFRISCQRLDKSFEPKSQKVCEDLGEFVIKSTGAKVKLVGADVDIGVEIIDGCLYLFDKRIPCFGGLPSGVEGKVLLDADQPFAELTGILMLKRGCAVIPFGKKAVPLQLLSAYNPQKQHLRVVKDKNDVVTLVAKEGALALVGSQQFPSDSAGLPRLFPLTSMLPSEIEKLEQKFSKARCSYIEH